MVIAERTLSKPVQRNRCSLEDARGVSLHLPTIDFCLIAVSEEYVRVYVGKRIEKMTGDKFR